MAASIIQRSDGRRFVSLRSVDEVDYAHELQLAIESSTGSLYLYLDLSNSAMQDAATRAGFVPEVITKAYEVPFPATTENPVQDHGRTWSQRLCTADNVSAYELFLLDLQLRQDVPGLAGWKGDRGIFDNEMASDDFDPTGYLVGVDETSGELSGLVRFWKNLERPRLGLLAVLPEHRQGFLAHRLFQAGLAGAGRWGFSSFEAHTARPGLQRRLERYGGSCTGSFAQMVRHDV